MPPVVGDSYSLTSVSSSALSTPPTAVAAWGKKHEPRCKKCMREEVSNKETEDQWIFGREKSFGTVEFFDMSAAIYPVVFTLKSCPLRR